MNWNNRLGADRRNLALIIVVLIVVGIGLVCLGVYFGMFVSKLVY